MGHVDLSGVLWVVGYIKVVYNTVEPPIMGPPTYQRTTSHKGHSPWHTFNFNLPPKDSLSIKVKVSAPNLFGGSTVYSV